MSKEETKQKIGKGQLVILTGFAVVVVALSVFGCYGCSYQPVRPPSVNEATNIIQTIKGTTWSLDEAGGPTTLPELPSKLKRMEILELEPDGLSMGVTLTYENGFPLRGSLVFLEGSGFTLKEGETTHHVTIVYSSTKDGNHETLTFKGNDSNTYLYYLKI